MTPRSATHISVVSKLKEEKRRNEVPHVIKEYLHLTASIVKTKFPNINTISSEQLIEKVQDFNFCDYYDLMMRIMKNEQMKLNQQNTTSNTSSTSFFSKFKGFFGFNDENNNNDGPININKQDDEYDTKITKTDKKKWIKFD